MSIILDGRAVAFSIEADLAARIALLDAKSSPPVLATILVGSDPASATYVKMKAAACRRVGLEPRPIRLAEETTTEQLLAAIDTLNADPRVCGILLQHPVPAHIDERACFDRISLDKDVDGVSSLGFGRMALGGVAYHAATPSGIMRLLAAYDIPLEGRHAVVIGRSPILGKPMAALLLNANATVTTCHSHTRDLPDVVRAADIVVAAVGKPRFVEAAWIRKDAVVIDAGYHPGGVGDVDLDAVAPLTSAYTPVPGGVGPMTIASLMAQSVAAAEVAADRCGR